MIDTLVQSPLAPTILAALVTSLVYALNRLFVKKEVVEEIKARMLEIRKNLSIAQQSKNLEAAEKWMKEFVSINNKYIKLTVKGIAVTSVVSVAFLVLVNMKYSGNMVKLPFQLPFLGNGLSSVYWYIFVSFVVGWLINKLVGG
jgi:uncharacterized membrane protein (DUF106 family)